MLFSFLERLISGANFFFFSLSLLPAEKHTMDGKIIRNTKGQNKINKETKLKCWMTFYFSLS